MDEQLLPIGADIVNILTVLDIECELRNAKENDLVQKFDFDLKNLKHYAKLKKAIEVLTACMHKDIQLAESETNHFAIEIKKPADKIYYRDYIQMDDANNKYSALIGIDNNGHAINFDVKKTIHSLIGGATGMGKTSLINSILYSLSKKNTKQTMQIALIDTKKTLAMWENLPILFDKPATDGYYASDLLSKVIVEMVKRTNKLSKLKMTKAEPDTFPHLLLVVDELADLMLASNKKYVEDKLVKIAQLGRAVNISIILATQNPIVKVCTSLIKANCPTRIALKTVSIKDSMNIFDNKKASTLSGAGDSMIRTADNPTEIRYKCLFLEDQEILDYVNNL